MENVLGKSVILFIWAKIHNIRHWMTKRPATKKNWTYISIMKWTLLKHQDISRLNIHRKENSVQNLAISFANLHSVAMKFSQAVWIHKRFANNPIPARQLCWRTSRVHCAYNMLFNPKNVGNPIEIEIIIKRAPTRFAFSSRATHFAQSKHFNLWFHSFICESTRVHYIKCND